MQTHAKSRASLAATDADQKARFLAGESVVDLVHERAAAIDELLRDLWETHMGELSGDVALVAVGGYGRGELHPCSDVDIMLLLPDSIDADAELALSAFITSLWDVGLEIGHSVRTVAQCVEQATTDLTVATTLMEARLIAGPQELFNAMQAAVGPDRVWSPQEFFAEKRREQIERHHRYWWPHRSAGKRHDMGLAHHDAGVPGCADAGRHHGGDTVVGFHIPVAGWF